MGSGKTSIGKNLSKLLNIKFYDLDEIIINFYKLNINNFFLIYGKFYFRIIENIILKFFLINNYYKSYILSIGGGTSCFFNNMIIMNKLSNTIYLKIKNIVLYKRLLINNNYNRPLLKKLKKLELLKFIIYQNKIRNNFYKNSKIIINIKYLNLKKTIIKLLNNLNKF
ncbi:MAG: shikimate kinase [Candidatus Shikimatogenerans sp. JK-2022]|nr:shikimate kinase [Candidatus Shikimatogenerans bostrichidophilus]